MVLLDANALIALCWTQHEHHETMHAWFKTHAAAGWATCPFTQAVFVRVSLQPTFSGASMTAHEIIELLEKNTAHPAHRYLSIDFDMAFVQSICTGGLLGHRQITDAWLLATAIKHRVKLLTFDAGLAMLLATKAERDANILLLSSVPTLTHQSFISP